MPYQKQLILLMIFHLLILSNCVGQAPEKKKSPLLGGPCQGCEAIYEYGDKPLSSIDTLPEFENNHPKLKVTGTVFQKDGKTPASDILLYFYQTNRKGLYESKPNATGWGKTHGAIRGWVKTNKEGKYTIYTFRPAAYPNRSEPEHIHITVKEPGKTEYYLDNYFFEDDPLLTNVVRTKQKKRGGSGIVTLENRGDYFLVKRDIVLGENIPNYY
jgi:protocatechuate 3,4-dioxygenase beta subunit